MTQVIDCAALVTSIRFFGRSTHWLLMPWRYRVSATIAYAEVWHCGRPIDGMFGCAFARPA
jgi:hypothetical protein